MKLKIPLKSRFAISILIIVKTAQTILFLFSPKKMRNGYLGNWKNNNNNNNNNKIKLKKKRKYFRVLTGDARNDMLGSGGYPYALKSVKDRHETMQYE